MTKISNKNLIALAVTVTLSVGALSAHAATTYTDVKGNWAHSDIDKLTKKNVMTGFSDGQFHPDAWVSRTEFSEMTLKVLDLPPSQVSSLPSVNNVAQNSWNMEDVDNQAAISAYPSGVTRPENPVRRAEVLAALGGTLNKPLVSDAEADKILSKYSDANQIPPDMKRQVATAIKYDLYTPAPSSGNMLNPTAPATRADVAAALENLDSHKNITIVQNGQVITPTQQTSTTTTSSNTTESGTTTSTETTASTTTTTTGTSQVRGSDEETTSTSSATPGELNDRGFKLRENTDNNPLKNQVPYRNSADTVSESRFGGAIANQEQITAAALPMNTTFTGTVAKALYSEFNRPGDPVVLILDHPLTGTDGKIVAPAGSKVLGEVSYVLPNNTTGDVAEMGINFNELVTPEGKRVLIKANVANNDGILRADALQGVVTHPHHSIAALSREISTAEGGLYGTKHGKMYVLETPLVSLGSSQPVNDLDQRITPNIIIGVGDRLQVRITGAATAPATSNPSSTTEENTTTQ